MREVRTAQEYREVMCSRCEKPCDGREDGENTECSVGIFCPCGGLTRGLSDDELLQMIALMDTWSVQEGEILLEEGESNNAVYLLLSGTMAVCKKDEEEGAEFEISRLTDGAFFGEMSWLDSGPASATVIALDECRVAAVPMGGLHAEIRSKVALNIARGVVSRLRKQNDAHVRSLVREAEELRIRNLFGRFYIVTMVLFGIVTIIPIYFDSAEKTGLQQMFNSWLALIILLLPMGYFLRKAHLPTSTFGLTLRGWKQSVMEAGIIVFLLAGLLLAMRWFLKEASDPFFCWDKMQGYTRGTFLIYLVLYPVHSFLQELISRGILQGALQVFLGDVHYLVPSFLVSILFGIAHLQYGLGTAWLTFTVSMIFGIVYYRHRNLVGVTIIHAVMGILAMAVGWV